MKKLILLAAFAVFGLSNVNAQDGVDKVIDQAKQGGFKVGANIGIAVSSASSDFGSFNFGFDAAYLFEVIDNLEVGLLVGYTQFVASGEGYYYENGDYLLADYKDASFVPIAASGRYYFNDRKMFGGLDLGYAIKVGGDDAVDGGFYYRPKFGFDLGKVVLWAGYQGISGGVKTYTGNNYNAVSGSGFNSFNVGVEFGF